jgi:hypothetical protein
MTKHPRRPFHAHRGSTLYKACSLALSLPNNFTREYSQKITDGLTASILHWASSFGQYNPYLNFTPQQHLIIRFILNPPPVPPGIGPKTIHLVAHHISQILKARTIDRCVYNQQHRDKKKEDKKNKKEREEREGEEDEEFHVPYDDDNNSTYQESINEKEEEETTQNEQQQQTATIADAPQPVPCPQGCNPLCNSTCLICKYFNYHHPSDACQWATTRSPRLTKPTRYKNATTPILFCMEDIEKLSQEDSTVDQNLQKEDQSQSKYTTSGTASLPHWTTLATPPTPKKNKKTQETFICRLLKSIRTGICRPVAIL